MSSAIWGTSQAVGTFLQAEELCRARGIELPQDFLEAAMNNGLRTIVLEEYIRLQVGGAGDLLASVYGLAPGISVLAGMRL